MSPSMIEKAAVMAQNSLIKRGFSDHVDPKSLYTEEQVQSIQIVACVVAGLSLVSGATTFFWFCRMKKKFRHNLIMILIIGDLLRSVFLFVFPLASLTRGHIQTKTPFCQASGYLTQTGVEIADLAVFFIALHTVLQIFKPKIGGYGELDNGLYRYRVAVYVIAATLPAGFVGMSFIGKNGGFMSLGPTCSLPLRPFWYRLAISWIPRYIIMIVVLVMYIVIYIHVGRVNGTFSFFGLFALKKPWETIVTPTPKSSKRSSKNLQQELGGVDGSSDRKRGRFNLRLDTRRLSERSNAAESMDPIQVTVQPPEESLPFHTRKISDGTTLVSHGSLDFAYTKPILVSPEFEFSQPLSIVNVDGPGEGSERKKSLIVRVTEKLARSPISPTNAARSPLHPEEPQMVGKKIMTKHMRKRQDAIQRQLGLLFLYPLCYFITYVPPFVAHCMQYSNYYVQHPIFSLNLLSFICLASLGWVDALVFSLRERPWRHIPDSDGTFRGSFCFWSTPSVRRESDDSSTGNELDSHNTNTNGSRRGSAQNMSHSSVSAVDQRDSWINTLTPDTAAPLTRPTATRAPSWSHFRKGSTILAAGPIPEEGESTGIIDFVTVPGSAWSMHTHSPARHLSNANSDSGMLASAGSIAGMTELRDQRMGSTLSGLSMGSGMSLGSEESEDREMAMMDRLLDRAVAREWGRPGNDV